MELGKPNVAGTTLDELSKTCSPISGNLFYDDGKDHVSEDEDEQHADSTTPEGIFVSLEERSKKLYSGEGLGPMVRASTIPLRSLALKYGADFVFTEELIDRSLSSTQRIVNTHLNTIDYIKFDPHYHTRITSNNRKSSKGHDSLLILRLDPQKERNKLICQIGTGDPVQACKAAVHVLPDVAAIDINMGCPKKFSIGGGMGSALLSDPNRACDIIRTISNSISQISSFNIDTGSSSADIHTTKTPIPVSAKIRLLPTIQGTIDFITALVNAGVNAITIHGRHVGDVDIEPAYWDDLANIVQICTQKFHHVPMLVNGDFYTRYEFENFKHNTKASGVVLSRPALYNTSIFIKPKSILSSTSQYKTNTSTETAPFDVNIDYTKPLLTVKKSANILYGYDSSLLLDKSVVIQEYLHEAIKYDGHYKNVKYVICEMMNLRRTPHIRVPYMHYNYSDGQTIGLTCAQNSIEDICKIWNVNYHEYNKKYHSPPSTSSTKSVDDNHATSSVLPDEHKYLDSYLLQQNENGDQPISKKSRIIS